MTGGERTVCVPACLVCGWTGEKGMRLRAEREGHAHEDGAAPPRTGVGAAQPVRGRRGGRRVYPEGRIPSR